MAARMPSAGEQLTVDQVFSRSGLTPLGLPVQIHDTGPGTAIFAVVTNLANAKPSGPPATTFGFWDSDAVPVFLDMFLDAVGDFAEIDVWKASCMPIIRWPTDAVEVVAGDALYLGSERR